MPATTCLPCCSTAAPSITDELVIRVLDPRRNGQIIRVKSARCTIGGGEHCTLRLRAVGVAPLHCLLIRGRAAAVVRCWHPDTRLNHRAFNNAKLAVGDVLSVGPIDFEVLDLGLQPPESIEPQPTASAAELAAALSHVERLQTQLADLQARDSALLDLELQRREIGDLRQQWQAERAAAESHSQDEQKRLADRAAELDARAAELDNRLATIEAQATAWRNRTAELDARTAELDARTADQQTHETTTPQPDPHELAWQQQHAAWLEQEAAGRKRFDELAHQFDARDRDLVDRETTLAARRREVEQHAAEVSARMEELSAREADLETRTAELTALENELLLQRSTLESQRRQAESSASAETPTEAAAAANPEPAPAAAPAQYAPVDLAEVFRRVGAKVETDEAEGKEPPPPPQATTRPRPASSPATEPLAHAADENEESIDDYMSRLMDRVRTASGETKKPMPAEPPQPAAAISTAGQSQPAQMPAAAPQSAAISVLPRTAAPERLVDLTALRELANFSAKSAINRHTRNVLIHTMYSKLAVAVVALVVAGAMFWLWRQWNGWEATFYSALVALLVAIYWGVEYAILSGRLMVDRKGHIDLKRPAAMPPAATPEPTADSPPESSG